MSSENKYLEQCLRKRHLPGVEKANNIATGRRQVNQRIFKIALFCDTKITAKIQ